MQNIVSLCSHCHNLLHYGRFEDKKPILEKLYNERKEALKECGIENNLRAIRVILSINQAKVSPSKTSSYDLCEKKLTVGSLSLNDIVI